MMQKRSDRGKARRKKMHNESTKKLENSNDEVDEDDDLHECIVLTLPVLHLKKNKKMIIVVRFANEEIKRVDFRGQKSWAESNHRAIRKKSKVFQMHFDIISIESQRRLIEIAKVIF